jgi:predicted Zn-dependent peptidase
VISYQSKQLANGLTFIHHFDDKTNLCVTNLLYNVGARDENPNKTGFAHLFEHLMFGGSVNIPSFDTPLQKASGENNAFTNNDITNYYITIPTQNLETALWLESDRMLRLDFSEKSLSVQRGVVIEEFKQRYLNQPYGDAWLHLRPLAYSEHPYQWATIGKNIKHIEDAELNDVIAFFEQYYNPSNAVLCIAGNIHFDEAFALVEKWFGDIPAGPVNPNKYIAEPPIPMRKVNTISANVPQNALYMAYQMVDRLDPLYFVYDLLSDILSGSDSSRFNQILIKDKQLFSHVHAYITGDIDKGLLVFEGKLNEQVEFEQAEAAILEIIKDIANNGIDAIELEKVKNKAITSNLFAKTSVLNKAMALCYAHLLGDINLINTEIDALQSISPEQIIALCNSILESNAAVLNYKQS